MKTPVTKESPIFINRLIRCSNLSETSEKELITEYAGRRTSLVGVIPYPSKKLIPTIGIKSPNEKKNGWKFCPENANKILLNALDWMDVSASNALLALMKESTSINGMREEKNPLERMSSISVTQAQTSV